MKRLYLLFLSLILIATLCQQSRTNQTNDLESLNWIRFEWVGYELGKRHFDKVAILLPLSIQGLPGRFNAQFDLGAVRSIFYENALKNYFKLYPPFSAKIDTTDKSMKFDVEHYMLRNVIVYIDSLPSPVTDYVVYKNFGTEIPEDSIETTLPKLIGTISADVCRNKFLIIDYPLNRLCFADSIDDELLNKFELVDFKMESGRIKIPFKMGNDVYFLMYDTGSSIFPILTDSTYWEKYADLTSNDIDTLNISSWGTWYDVYGAPLKTPVFIGERQLENKRIYLNPRKDFAEFFRREQVLGITGNAYFLNETVIIDFKHTRFGILRKQ